MTPALAAAVDAGRQHGLSAEDPVVVQETNNAVIWLQPHEVIAKVGMWQDSANGILREYHVARALARLGAPVAEPFHGSTPVTHSATGFIVTLWHRLECDPTSEPDAPTIGASLRELHRFLAASTVEVPDFRGGLRRARRALDDQGRFSSMTPADVALLRKVFDTLMPDLDARNPPCQPLHGEPHDGNRLMTPAGIRWIDFESACRGPLEWDLAFLPDDARETFREVDHELLDLLSLLNSGRVATWCWLQAHFPEMRWHAEHHLGTLRGAFGM